MFQKIWITDIKINKTLRYSSQMDVKLAVMAHQKYFTLIKYIFSSKQLQEDGFKCK